MPLLGQASAARLQAALSKVGELPGLLSMQFDDKTVRGMESYWENKGIQLPCRPSPEDVQKALVPLMNETSSLSVGIRLAYEELLDIGTAYVQWKKDKGEFAGWFSCYWPWVVGGGAVVVTVGGYAIYRATRKR